MPIAGRGGGIERHAAELPAALLEVDPSLRLVVIASRDLPPQPWEDAASVLRLPLPDDGRLNTIVQLAGTPLGGLARRLDLIHSVSNVGPPAVPGLKTVTTVHDLIWLHAGTDWGTPEAVTAMRRVALRSARWATRVQASSLSTAADLQEHGGVKPASIDVVPLGVSAGFATPEPEDVIRERLSLGTAPVVLAVAQKRPYKNLAAAIEALDAVPDAVLVLPGAPTDHERELKELARARGVDARVRFPDWVDDSTLEGLYGLAACVVVPSFFEGFGFPVLEAMARGVPVACARSASLPEVAGDAALLFDPHSGDELAGAMRRLVADGALRARLRAAGVQRAAEYTWRRCAEETLASYRRALDG